LFLRSAMCDWIDPDTPIGSLNMNSPVDGSKFHLVYSDEFNVDGRSFADGHDPRWTAIHKNDYTNSALHFYNENLVTTRDGALNITTVVHDVTFPVDRSRSRSRGRSRNMRSLREKSSAYTDADTDPPEDVSRKTTEERRGARGTAASGRYKTKHYQSGMLQGWNKFCFTGGILEIRARLPGKAHTGGLWPAMWLMGNLARATYVESSNNVWPWSYNTCPANAQAAHTLQQQQQISACNNIQHYALLQQQGRGAPEIDLLEAMPGYTEPEQRVSHLGVTTTKPFFSSSFQVSPAVESPTRPVPGQVPRFDPSTAAGRMQRLAYFKEKQKQKQKEEEEEKENVTKESRINMTRSDSKIRILGVGDDASRGPGPGSEDRGHPAGMGRRLKAGLWDWLSIDPDSSRSGGGADGSGTNGETDLGDDDTVTYSRWYDHGLSYGINTTLNIYFYGLQLASTSTGASYATDSISSNTNLNPTHFNDFHTYTLEWQPKTYLKSTTRHKSGRRNDVPSNTGANSEEGEDILHNESESATTETSAGWLAWYLDGHFLFRIDGDALDVTGAIIPEEPMYVILNTAISSTWGFPAPCPEGCPYCQPDNSDDDSVSDAFDSSFPAGSGSTSNCYDCRRTECACSMPADMCSNFPASFLIDYVRVYQTDDSHTHDKPYSHGSDDAEDAAGDATDSDRSQRIRRYQRADSLSCSTRTHPSTTYIDAHKHLYMRATDTSPLQEVAAGGGACVSNSIYGSATASAYDDYSVYDHTWTSASLKNKNTRSENSGKSADMNTPHKPIGGLNDFDIDRVSADKLLQKGAPLVLLGPKSPCGGPERGTCRVGRCVCHSGYTGPLCLAYVAHNDIDYDALAETPLTVHSPRVQVSVKALLLIGGSALCILVYIGLQNIRRLKASNVELPILCSRSREKSSRGYMSLSADEPNAPDAKEKGGLPAAVLELELASKQQTIPVTAAAATADGAVPGLPGHMYDESSYQQQ